MLEAYDPLAQINWLIDWLMIAYWWIIEKEMFTCVILRPGVLFTQYITA